MFSRPSMSFSSSGVRPRSTSMIRATISASPAPPQALSTMARSSRRLGAKMPGVSMKTSWALSVVTTPRTWLRVVCALCVTMETLVPTRALSSVDLPALGAPTRAMKPQAVSMGSMSVICWPIGFLPNLLRDQEQLGGLVFGDLLGRANSAQRFKFAQGDGDGEFGGVVRAAPVGLGIGGGLEATGLGPFLEG